MEHSRRIFLLSAALSTVLVCAGCTRFRADLEQTGWTTATVTIRKEGVFARAPLADTAVTLRKGKVSEALKTDAAGRVTFDLAGSIPATESVVLRVGDEDIVLPRLRTPRIQTRLECNSTPRNYYRIALSCRVSTMREAWPVQTPPVFVTEAPRPAEGPATIRFGSVERRVSFRGGLADLRPQGRDEAALLAAARVVLLESAAGSVPRIPVDLPPQDGQVVLVRSEFGPGRFSGSVQNRTLDVVRVRIRAGEKKEGTWHVGSVTRIDHFGESVLDLLPGEAKEVSLAFVPTPFTDFPLETAVEVVGTRAWDPGRDDADGSGSAPAAAPPAG